MSDRYEDKKISYKEHIWYDSCMNYTNFNAEIISGWVKNGWIWGTEINHETYLKAQEGEWDVVLTPVRTVPHEWLMPLEGKKLLGLASGGGQQMPIFSALGAECTLMDISDAQCEKDRIVSKRENFSIDIVKGDMTKPFPFSDESFDIVFHPVSNCYVQDIQHIFNEVYRILKKGGRFIAGLSLDMNYVVDEQEEKLVRKLPFNPLSDELLFNELMRSNDGIQFSHSIEESIRGQLEAGFTLKDIYQDTNGEGRLHELGVATFLATYASKD